MKRTRFELRRRLAKLHPNKKIGGTDHPELMNIPGNRKIYVYADTETFYFTNGMKPWEHMGKKHIGQVLAEMDVLPFIVCWQFRRHKGGKHGKALYESGGVYDRVIYMDNIERIESLLMDLSYIFNDWGCTPVLVFHNASYDLAVLEPIFRELDPTMTFYFYTDDKKHFIRGSMQSEKYNFFCEFDDSLKYDKNMSIEKAGSILGYPKLEGLPYGLCDVGLDDDDNIYYYDIHTGQQRMYSLERYMEYARRDVEIMRRYIERINRQKDLVNEIMVEDWSKMDQRAFNRKCSTRPSHSKNICNRYLEMKGWAKIDEVFRFEITDQMCSDPKELYRQTFESNNGGFTTNNTHIRKYDCKEDQIIRYFDRNSMYPTIMTEKLPYGDLLREHERPDDYTTWYVVKLNSLKWKGNMQCIKYQPFSDKKVNARRPIFVEKEYFDFVRENCDIDYEIIDTWYQANTTVIRPLIEMYYNKRKECRSEMKRLMEDGDDKTSLYEDLDDQQQGLKLLMNSLYGKLCEKGHHTGIVYYESKYTKYKQEDGKFPCILSGSYITYRGRLSLMKKIKAVVDAGYDFLYADTDSVILGCPRDADMTKIFGEDHGNLGEWKEEGQFDMYLNSGNKKKYYLINRRDKHLPLEKRIKYALSGIHTKVQKMIENEFRKNFEKATEMMIYFFDPKNNVCIERCKPTTTYTNAYNQPIIYNVNFQMNPSLKKITAYMRLTDEGIKLEICT